VTICDGTCFGSIVEDSLEWLKFNSDRLIVQEIRKGITGDERIDGNSIIFYVKLRLKILQKFFRATHAKNRHKNLTL